MSKWTHSDFLDAPPDLAEDHRYLSRAEVLSLPAGVYYKKKDVLTRHRFIHFVLSDGHRDLICEAVDDRGYWRLERTELHRIAAAIGLPADATPHRVLSELGLENVALAPEAPLPHGVTQTPQSKSDVERLYANYTDMQAQGHFDPDSPDLDRLELLTSWIPPGTRTLDLGCNSGTFGAVLIEKGCEVHGVDLSEALVAQAKLRGVHAIRSWAEETPYGSAEFGAVVCAELLEHALDPVRILHEARRVLVSGGLLVGSVPHAQGPWGHEDMGHHPEHLWAFEDEDLRRLLQEAGFTQVTFEVQTHGTGTAVGLAFRARAL